MATKPPKRRRIRRIAIIVAGVVLVLVLLVAVLVPTVGASIAKGKFIKAASGSIAGTVELDSLSLSWMGKQRVSGVTVVDEQGVQVAQLNASVDRGLLSLIFGPTNLGEVTLSGSARLERNDNGAFTILEATKPTKPDQPKSDEPASIPAGLNIKLNIDAFDLEIVDAGQSSHIKRLRGGAAIRPAQPIAFTLTSDPIEHRGNAEGSINIRADLINWSTADGAITTDTATLDAKLELINIPSDLARVLAGVKADLASGLGDNFTIVTTAQGTPNDMLASMSFNSRHAQTSASVRLAKDVIELTAPLTASAETIRLARAIPSMAGILETAEKTLEFQSDPRAAVTISALRIPRDDEGLALDQASASASIELPPVDALLTLQDQDRQVALAPTSATLTLSPESGVQVTSSGSATIDARDAGQFKLDASLARLFDDSGELAFDAQQVGGSVAIQNLDVELAQPWMPTPDVQLAQAIGPTLSARVDVEPAEDGRAATLDVASEKATARGSLLVTDSIIRSASTPLEFSLQADPALVNALLGDDAPIELTRAGTINARLADLRLDLDQLQNQDEGLKLDKGAITAGLTLGVQGSPQLRLAREGATPIALDSATMTAAINAQGLASASAEVASTHNQTSFATNFRIDSADLTAILEGRYAQSGIRGSGAIENAPVSLLDQLGITLTDANNEPIDLAQLSADTLGDTISASLALQPNADTIAISGSLNMRELNAELAGALAIDALQISKTEISGTIRPRTMETLLTTFAPEFTPKPRLASKTDFLISARPASMNLDGEPNTEPLGLTVSLSRVDLRGLGLDMGEDDRRFLGPILVDAFDADFSLKPGDAQNATAKLAFNLLDREENPIGSLDLDAARTEGVIRGRANLQGLSLALADRLLKSDSLVTGAIGPTLGSDIEFDLTEGISLTAVVDTERLQTEEPISFALRDDAIEVGPLAATLDLDGDWVNEHLPLSKLAVASRTRISLETQPTSLPRGQSNAPLAFDARLKTDRLALALDSGEGEMLNQLDVHLRTDPETPELIHFDAGALRDMSEPGSRAIEATGSIQLARDQNGAINPDQSVLNLRASANNAPIAFLDAFFDQGGVLRDLVGATANAEIVADNLTAERGGLRLVVNTPNTAVNLRGRVRDGAFRARPLGEDDPPQIQITSFSPEFSARISEVIPLISQVEKRPDDRPAALSIHRLELPIDGDLTKLNANLDIDLGTAGLKASRAFAPFLKALSWDVDASAGNRLKPINLRAREGIIRYRNVEIPLGEFTVTLQGEANLAERSIDAITYLPFGTLSSEFGTDIQGQITSVLGPLGVAPDMETLRVPIRLSGSMDAPKASLAGDLFVESLKQSFKPEDLLQRGLQDALKRIGGG